MGTAACSTANLKLGARVGKRFGWRAKRTSGKARRGGNGNVGRRDHVGLPFGPFVGRGGCADCGVLRLGGLPGIHP